MAGSLLLAQRPGGVGLRVCFSLSIFRFSNLFKACADIPMVPGSPPPPPPPKTPSSNPVRSSKLPAALRFISTPLSLLLVLPSGERSLLQDDWPPGLGWDFWWTEGERLRLVLHVLQVRNKTGVLLCYILDWLSPEQSQGPRVCSLPCASLLSPAAVQSSGLQESLLSQGVGGPCLHDASWWCGLQGRVPSSHVSAGSLGQYIASCNQGSYRHKVSEKEQSICEG